MNQRLQTFCLWSGAIGLTLFFLGLVVAQYFPFLPGPYFTQEQVVASYQENTMAIRIGMVLMLASGLFIPQFVALISVYLRRIEGARPLMAYTQLSTGTAGVLFFILPAMLFLGTAFRPDRMPEITYMLNDFSWLFLVMVWPPFALQNISIGIAVLSDKSANPIFPRWLGFLNLWVSLLLAPASLVPFFKSGPFAWNGLFGFWIPAAAFGIWFTAMFILLQKAIKNDTGD